MDLRAFCSTEGEIAKFDDHARGLAWDQVTAGSGYKHVFKGTRHDDDLAGTRDNDLFYLQRGGDDSVDAGKGDDYVVMGASLTARDRIDGGIGNDTVAIEGEYDDLILGEKTFRGVETLLMAGPHVYHVQLPATMDTDGAFTINGNEVGGTLIVDGTRLTDVSLTLWGSSHDDMLVGGAADDLLDGGFGADFLDGGAGRDIFRYLGADQSDADIFDTIQGFQHGVDRISLSDIDANAGASGDQAFVFGGNPGQAGALTVQFDFANGFTLIEGFTNVDAAPDLVIKLLGIHTDLAATDFIL